MTSSAAQGSDSLGQADSVGYGADSVPIMVDKARLKRLKEKFYILSTYGLRVVGRGDKLSAPPRDYFTFFARFLDCGLRFPMNPSFILWLDGTSLWDSLLWIAIGKLLATMLCGGGITCQTSLWMSLRACINWRTCRVAPVHSIFNLGSKSTKSLRGCPSLTRHGSLEVSLEIWAAREWYSWGEWKGSSLFSKSCDVGTSVHHSEPTH